MICLPARNSLRSCIVGRRLRSCRIAAPKPIAVRQFRASGVAVRRVTHAVTFAALQCQSCLWTPDGEPRKDGRENRPRAHGYAHGYSSPERRERPDPKTRAPFLRGRSRCDRAGQRAAPLHSTPAREAGSTASDSECQFADVLSCASRDGEPIGFDAVCAVLRYGVGIWSAVESAVSDARLAPAAASRWTRRASSASGTSSLWHAWRPSATGSVPRRASSA